MFDVDTNCPLLNPDCYIEGGCENCFMRVDNLLGKHSGTTEAGVTCQKEFIMKKMINGVWVNTDCSDYSDLCHEGGCDACHLEEDDIIVDDDEVISDEEYEDIEDYDDDEEDDSDFFEGEFFVDEDCPNFNESCLAVGCRDCTLYEGDSEFEDDNFGA